MTITASQILVAIDADTKGIKSGLSSVEGLVKSSGSIFSGALSTFFGMGALQLATNGINLVKDAITGTISAAAESEQVLAQTNAVLKSTHGVSGQTAQSIQDLASKLQSLTGIDDEAVQGAENMLATFDQIRGTTFPQATQAIADMATSMNGGAIPSADKMRQTAILVGKALQDPILGVSALQRVGVRLTEQQKEQVKAMMAAGDVAGAQAVILGELQKEYGGAAEAAGSTFAGQLAILQGELSNVREAIGKPILEALNNLLHAVNPLITAIGNGLPGGLDAAGKAVAPLGDLFKQLSPAFQIIISDAKGIAQALFGIGDGSSKTQGPLSLLSDLVKTVTSHFGDIQAVLINVEVALYNLQNGIKNGTGPFGFLKQVIEDARATLNGLGTTITQHILPVLLDFGGFVVANVLPALLKLGDFIMTTVLPAAMQLASWFVENVEPVLKTVVGVVVNNVLPALEGIAKTVIEQLLPPLEHIIGKVLPVLQFLFGIVGWLLQNVIGPILQLLITILGKLLEVLGWLIDRIGDFLGFLGDLKDKIGELLGKIGEFLGSVFAKIGEFKDNLIKKFEEIRDGMLSKIMEARKWVIDHFEALKLEAIAKIQGLHDKFDAILSNLKNIASNAWEGVKTAFKNGVNLAIDNLNNLIHQLNKLQIHIPSVSIGNIKTPAFDWNGLNIKDIPKLALGGLISAEGWAIVGDAGPELVKLPTGAQVIPNGQSTHLLEQSAAGSSTSGSGNTVIYLQLDGRTVAHAVVPHIPGEVRLATGRRI